MERRPARALRHRRRGRGRPHDVCCAHPGRRGRGLAPRALPDERLLGPWDVLGRGGRDARRDPVQVPPADGRRQAAARAVGRLRVERGPAAEPLVHGGGLFQGPVGPRLSLFTNGASVAIPICMAYAIVKHRVLDIRVVVRRGVQYLLARRALQVGGGAARSAVLAYAAWSSHRHRTIAGPSRRTAPTCSGWRWPAVGLRFRAPDPAVAGPAVLPRAARSRADPAGPARRRRTAGVPLGAVAAGHLEARRRPASEDDVRLVPGSRASSPPPPRRTRCSRRRTSRRRAGGWRGSRRGRGAARCPRPAEAGLSPEEARWFAEREVGTWSCRSRTAATGWWGRCSSARRSPRSPTAPTTGGCSQAIAKQTAVVRENLRLRARVSEEQRIRHDVLAQAGRPAARPAQGVPGLRRVLRRRGRPLRRGRPAAGPLPAGRANRGRPVPARAPDRKGRHGGGLRGARPAAGAARSP